jgi:hypothetical protein
MATRAAGLAAMPRPRGDVAADLHWTLIDARATQQPIDCFGGGFVQCGGVVVVWGWPGNVSEGATSALLPMTFAEKQCISDTSLRHCRLAFQPDSSDASALIATIRADTWFPGCWKWHFDHR